MPIVRIEMLAGRPAAKQAELIRRVTEAVAGTLDVRPEQVRVLLYEIAPEHWAVGGRTMAEGDHTGHPTPDTGEGGEK